MRTALEWCERWGASPPCCCCCRYSALLLPLQAAGPRPRLSMMGGRLSASALGSIGLGARKGAAAGAATSVAGAAGANAAALARKRCVAQGGEGPGVSHAFSTFYMLAKRMPPLLPCHDVGRRGALLYLLLLAPTCRALLRAHSAGADAAAAAEAGALGAAADAAAAATAAKQGADATAAPPTSGHGRRIVWNPDGSLSIAPAAAAKQAPAGAEAQAAPQFGDGVPAASSLAGAAQEHKGEATRRSAAPAATAVGAAGLGAAGRAARARISWAAGQSEEASTPGVESPVRDSARGAAGGEEEAAFEQRPAGTRPCLAAHSSGPPGAAPRQHQVLAAAAGSGQDSGGVAEAGARQPDQGEELMDEEDGPDPHAGTQAGHGVSAGAAAAARGRSGQRHGPVANGGGTEALQGGAEGGEEERGKGSRRLQEDEDEDGPQGAPQEGAETDEVPAAPSRRATGRLAGRLGAAVTPGAGLGAAAAAAAAAQGGAAAPGGPTPRSSSGAKREPRGLAGSLFGAAMRGLHRSSVSSDRP